MSRVWRLLGGLVLSWHCSLSWAGPVPDATAPTPVPVPAPQQFTSLSSFRSEANRQTQEFGLWAGFGIRAAELTFVEVGAEVAYFLQPNDIISLRVTNLSGHDSDYGMRYDNNDFTIYSQDMQLDGKAYRLSWKSFLSNSFNVKGGIEQLNLRGEYFDNRTAEVHYHLGDLTQQSAFFSIGNQWQWRYFTMGCDWGGLTFPLAYNYISHYDEVDSNMTRKFANIGKKTYTNLLFFYLGASF